MGKLRQVPGDCCCAAARYMRTRLFRSGGLVLMSILVQAACGPPNDSANAGEATLGATEALVQAGAPPPIPYPTITQASSNFPTDIPGGAATANLQTAAQFAWAEFIALSWPAVPTTRDSADTGRRFGDSSGGPLVWETFRSKVETFPLGPGGDQSDKPPGYVDDASQSYGYFEALTGEAPNDYVYEGRAIPACGTASATTPWVNLDEITQISLNDMFAGTVDGDISDQLIRFAVKGNRTQYVYVAANGLFDRGTRNIRSSNFSKALFDQATGAPLPNAKAPDPADVVRFPGPDMNSGTLGTIKVKSGWRKVGAAEAESFHTQTVRLYENDPTNDGNPCYEDETWGLVALHIMSRVASTPDYFTFATFEHGDNILSPDGTPVEDADGNVGATSADSPTTPELSYMDGDTSKVSKTGDFCASPQSQLFYVNIAPFQPPHGTATDSYGFGQDANICINYRTHPIPPPVIGVNAGAHAAITAYVGGPSVWDNYKLVNVQWKPFNKADVVADPSSDFNAATFYLANIVVETNYTLQNFSGRQAINGTPTDMLGFSFPRQPPNTYTFPEGAGGAVVGYNMGGCMGCHGVAQTQSGADFSFVLSHKFPAEAPEFPHPVSKARVLEKYAALRADDVRNR